MARAASLEWNYLVCNGTVDELSNHIHLLLIFNRNIAMND